jgi:NADPH-dependent ferric siderophore reductase
MAALPGPQRRSYERRLVALEASVERLSCWLMAADETTAPRLLNRLETIDLEIELLNEALAG